MNLTNGHFQTLLQLLLNDVKGAQFLFFEWGVFKLYLGMKLSIGFY